MLNNIWDIFSVGSTVRLDDMLVANTTVTSASLDLHVARVTPAPAPGVLDEPVVHTSLLAISHHCDLMVQCPDAVWVCGGLTTSAVIIHSTTIVTKVGSLNIRYELMS